MRKILAFTLLLLFLFFASCKNSDPITPQSKTELSGFEDTEFYLRLSNLSTRYVKLEPKQSPCRIQVNEFYEPGEFGESRDEKVNKADAEGFAIGGGIGGVLGGAVGTLVGAAVGLFTGPQSVPTGALIGGAAGTLTAGVIAGTIYAVIWSKEKAKSIEEEQQEGSNGGTMIAYNPNDLNSNNPINNFSQGPILFNDSIAYANIGFVHNYIISSSYNEFSTSLFDISESGILDYIFQNIIFPYEGMESEFFMLHDYIYDNIENDYANYVDMERPDIESNYDEVVSFYFENIPSIPESRWRAYTEDYMRIVDEELSLCDSNRVMLINGCLSTFIYSKYLWNFNAANISSGRYIFFYPEQELWLWVEDSDIYSQYISFLTNEIPCLIFVPQFEDGVLKSMTLYDELSLLDYANETSQLYLDEGNLYLSLLEDVSVASSPFPLFVPGGTFEFRRFNKGYFIVIN